jgi:ABC-type polar amino acid transport system ATPase subunit
MNQPILSVRGLRKSFGRLEVLRGVDLQIEQGEVVCLIGASGSGKSTLVRCLNLLEPSDRGEILFEGRPIQLLSSMRGRAGERARSAVRADIGMVFQSFNLWPQKTVIGNIIEAPVLVRGTAREVAEQEAIRLLTKVGLAEKARARPSSLSGGQQQRVAIARALAMSPKLMLFDEPTSSLDPELTEEVLSTMRLLAQDGMTMICVTHEMYFARNVADRMVVMDEGRIVESGPPEHIFGAPTHERTRRFLRQMTGHTTAPES